MKATIVEEKSKNANPVFPCLRKSNHDKRLVVLFTDFRKGVVIVPSDTHTIGEYSDEWSLCDDYIAWEEVTDITINFKF
jgi:hypothetical protein